MKSPESSQEKTKPLFTEIPEIARFITDNKIEGEDTGLLVELSEFPTELVILELHNLFSLSKDDSETQIRQRINQLDELLEDETDEYYLYKLKRAKELLEKILLFLNTYGWQTSHVLVRLLEEYSPNKTMLTTFKSTNK